MNVNGYTGLPSSTSAPTSIPTSSSSSAALSTATLKGQPGFIAPSGMTVYVFDADLGSPNASTCNGTCANSWPPVTPPSGALPSGWTSFQRQDGSMQLAYKTRALYTFSGDVRPGDTNGDGVNAFGGLWHVARP